MKWPTRKLADVCSIKTGKLDSNEAVPGGEFPFFTCAPETLRINKFSFDTEAVLLAGNNASGVYPLKYYEGKFDAYQRTYVLESLDKNCLNPRFLYYSLNLLLEHFQSVSIGAATQYLTKAILNDLPVSVPTVAVQNEIADALFAYDELMENNRRRMALLEEAARMLYREWFVRLRFPGHEHARLTHGIPEGWRKNPLRELADVTMGQSPESKFYNESGEGLPFHQGVADFGDRFVTNRIYTTALNRIANAGDILCSVRAPVGRLNITLDKIVIGRGLAALRSRLDNQSFLLHQLRTHFFKEDLIGAGAIFASVTKAEFESQMLVTPPSRLIQEFEDFSGPIDEQLRVLHLQNQKLRAARDLLLPRLMSGEIAV